MTPFAIQEEPFVDSGPRTGPPDALVLDIGGDVGALIVYTDESCLGSEIDLTPAGSPRSHDLHTMVRRRRATGRDVVAGLYPEVRQGRYTVWGINGTGPLGEVEVTGGRVGEFHAGDARGAGPALPPEAHTHDGHTHSHAGHGPHHRP
jgi:hypothetical protein